MIQCINNMSDKTLAHLIKTHPKGQRLAKLAAETDTYDVVIIGPAHPGALKNGWILSTNGRAYAAADLAAWAGVYAGRRVFYRHGGQRGPGYDQRLLQGQLAKVGWIVASWWQPDANEVRGRLRVDNPNWRRTFASPARWQYGFSHNVDGRTIHTLEDSSGACDLVQLTSIVSVDLVDNPAAGGRFIGAPAMTPAAVAAWWDDFKMITQEKGASYDS